MREVKEPKAPTYPAVVYHLNGIMLVPVYNGKGWVGPGYFYEHSKVFHKPELEKLGAVRDEYYLWRRV
jgi:hypothetical protein